jgi:aspartyl protease family protein
VSTANGQAMAARVTLRRVEIDGVRVDDVEGMVMPEGAMRGSLLGMSFLSRLSGFKVEDGVLHLKN